MQLSNQLKRFELHQSSQWINADIRPLESLRRTWTFSTFHNTWLLTNCNIATYLTGSALIPLGLTWWQAIIAIVIGKILATVAVLLSCLTGAHYHIGFSVTSRAIWGMWGAQFAIWNRIFLAFTWYAFQAWVGGECFYLILLAFDPQYESRIPNKLPAETGMTSAQFLAYFLFSIISLPSLLIPPHKLQKFFSVASGIMGVFFLVLLIWALSTMGPSGFGSTLDSNTHDSGPASTPWLMVYGIMSTIGSISAGILSQNDYSRYSKRPSYAIWGQAFACPAYSTLGSVVGILVTAATQQRLGGEAVWNPPALFSRLLENDNSPGIRAALFFAGIALCVSQIGCNLPGNALAGGMDLAAVFPRYVNIKRGAFIIAILSPVANPWRLVNTATVFVTVLSSYGVFLAPITGMMAAGYLVVNKQRLNIDHLYVGDATSIYWYTRGVNWRAVVAWIVGVAPCLPGFIATINLSVKVTDGAIRLFYLNYLYGFLASAFTYVALHWAFPSTDLDEFVRQQPSSKVLRKQYEDQWEVVTSGLAIESAGTDERDVEHCKGASVLTTSS